MLDAKWNIKILKKFMKYSGMFRFPKLVEKPYANTLKILNGLLTILRNQ